MNIFLNRYDIPDAESRSVLLADFDGDGDPDLFVASADNTGNLIFFNVGRNPRQVSFILYL